MWYSEPFTSCAITQAMRRNSAMPPVVCFKKDDSCSLIGLNETFLADTVEAVLPGYKALMSEKDLVCQFVKEQKADSAAKLSDKSYFWG